ncbi:GTPase activating protein [Scleroderma citrinum]
MSTQNSSASSEDRRFELTVSVELYITTTAGSGLRKNTISHRKVERAEYGKPFEEATKKVKEKSNWMSITRPSLEPGQWRPATCKVLDEDNDCLLYIYIDDTILYQTVSIHKLNHTDVRLADSSMFLRKNCVEISLARGPQCGAAAGSEPIYLHFNDTDTCKTWLVLLRSYAKPEIYGLSSVPCDGGLYRMWRQIDLVIMQGRYLGNAKSFVEPPIHSALNGEHRAEADPVDLDVFCEIRLNDRLCGRTTVKKGIGSPEWHESFLFSDLPPFATLEIFLFKERRLTKPVLLGSIRIALTNFRRSEDVEGWFPVTQPRGPPCSILTGEIRMKLRVDEEIILPHSNYSGILEVLQSRDILEWMEDFERKLQLRTMSEHLMDIAIVKDELVEHIMEYSDREVDGTPSSHNTLFRGNTTFTKTMELAMEFYGRSFLEASIGKIVRRLCSEGIAIEVDPVRIGKGPKDTERGVEELVKWCQMIWDSIYANRNNCPHEIRRLLEHVRKLVEERYKRTEQGRQNRELPWQSVSAFCFLRFIVPAILHPYRFGLYPSHPDSTVQRSLTLIAKVIQSLANLNATVQKEEFMRGVKDFLQENLQAMVDYILVVSTPVPAILHPHDGSPAFSHCRLQVVNSLRRRGATMSTLNREAIPLLPHGLDVPRRLACISSALVRRVRIVDQKTGIVDQGDQLHDLYVKCIAVEEVGLQRVSQSAGMQTRLGGCSPGIHSFDVPHSPSCQVFAMGNRKQIRPSTAPSLPDPVAFARGWHTPQKNGSPPSSITHYPSSLRRGSLPDLYPSHTLFMGESPGTGYPRSLRPSAVAAHSTTRFIPRVQDVGHPPTHSLSLSATLCPQQSFPPAAEEVGRKRKNILTGLFPWR